VKGITVGSYNLPDWEDSPEGFSRCLTALFQHTPPTALIIGTIELFAATQQFLLQKGIRVPQDVSIVCSDPHPTFAWCKTVSHISYDSRIWVRNTIRWVNKLARGENDRRQVISKSKFIEGGTVGPAKPDASRTSP
jgi:DNA-binding LacI/PurR family transcriptional regulator